MSASQLHPGIAAIMRRFTPNLLKNLKDVRCAVHEYLSTGEKPGRLDPELGLCSAVALHAPSPELRREYLILLSDLAKQWPEFSGYYSYPVPHLNERPDRAFYLASPEDMWSPESAYGAARLRLLDWLIARLEAEIEAETKAEIEAEIEAETEATKETQDDHP